MDVEGVQAGIELVLGFQAGVEGDGDHVEVGACHVEVGVWLVVVGEDCAEGQCPVKRTWD